MKTLLPFFLLIAFGTTQAQGLVEKFDTECNCYIITNHYDDGTVSGIHHENVKRQRHGIEEVYSSEGKLNYRRNWENGKLDGEGIHYHSDGSIYLKDHHDHGKKVGTWVFTDPQGTKVQQIEYTGKGSDGVYAYFHSGIPYLEQTIEKGKMIENKILNQERYNLVVEEAKAAEAGKN